MYGNRNVIITLLPALCACVMRCLTLRKEYKLQMPENKVSKKIVGTENDTI
jgi:hypothetical protein